MINATPVGRRPTARIISEGRENAMKRIKTTPAPSQKFQLVVLDAFGVVIFFSPY
tara:strand:+ start:232 stop:396 length:165 start_codon:yes stop_codon:yes gene_type:complete